MSVKVKKELFLDKIDHASEVMAKHRLPTSVTINDVTLREATQVASFGIEEKVEIAHALDDLGLKHIQIGIPGVNQKDAEVIRRLKASNIKAGLEAVCFLYKENWKSELDSCIDCAPDSITLFQTVSDDKLAVMDRNYDFIRDKCMEAIAYAKSQGVKNLGFCPFPANRTEFSRFCEILQWSEEAGADMVLVTDTYGTSSPTAINTFIRKLKQVSALRLGIHCHNDMGLALANTIAAVEAGVDWVETSVNGLGDRAGNCCLDELIVALEGFYGIDTKLKTHQLFSLSRLVENLVGIPLPFGKPLVGDNAFVHRHDDDVQGALTIPSSTVPIEASFVGNKRRIEIGGGYFGPITVKAKASELGIDIPDILLNEVLALLRSELSDSGYLSDQEFMSVVSDLVG